MALYKKDHRLAKAKEVIAELDPTDLRDSSIIYYIEKLQKANESNNAKLKEYKEFFETMAKFMPRSGPIVFK